MAELSTEDKLSKLLEIAEKTEYSLINLASDMKDVKQEMRGLKSRIMDLETYQYGQRTQNGNAYRPSSEPTESTGVASIEPVQAWRRRTLG